MSMEQQLSAGEAGHLLRALERLEKLLVAAEAERMSPHHPQLMEEARFLGLAIGCRVMRLAGGAAVVRDEWRQPSEPDEEISDHVELDALLDLTKNPVMTYEQADGMPKREEPG